MKKTLRVFCMCAILVVFAAAAVFAQQNASGAIRPPAWIQGEWQNNDGGNIFSLGMKADDILWDGSSLGGMVRGKKIRFSQKETNAGYEIFFQFLSDRYWYKETFSKPGGDSLSSSFVDSLGAKKRYTYTKAAVVTEPRGPAPQSEPPRPAEQPSVTTAKTEITSVVTPLPPEPEPVAPPFIIAPAVPAVSPPAVATPIAPAAAPSQEEALRGKITATARKYLGATYIYGAQNPPRAFDCSGFVGQAYKEGAGVVLPRTARALATMGTGVNRNNIKPGDIIYFDIRGCGVISHVALVLDSQRMIHAVAEGKGMAITTLNDKWYAPKIAGYRSLFSDGEIPRSGGIRDGIGIGARLTDRPLSEIFIDVTGKPEKTTDDIKMAMQSGLHFTLTNKTGRESNFDVYFYQSGTGRNKGDHERIFLKANETRELDSAFFAEKPGRYQVEILKAGAALVEKTWIVE